MGQPVAVVERPSRTPGVVRFEANRNLTGMGHEVFRHAGEAIGPRPSAELARRLFATGKVDSVHVYGNVISVDLGGGQSAEGIAETVRDLYQYWRPGMVPPAFEEPGAPDQASGPEGVGSDGGGAASDGGSAASDGGGAALSEAAKRVPAHLLERSRMARDRARSKPV